jgi:hypothetical protein
LIVFVQDRQFVNHNFEIWIGISGAGLANHLKLHRVFALGTAWKDLPGKQGHFMGQAMACMNNSVNPAMRDGLASIKLLFAHPAVPFATRDAGAWIYRRCNSDACSELPVVQKLNFVKPLKDGIENRFSFKVSSRSSLSLGSISMRHRSSVECAPDRRSIPCLSLGGCSQESAGPGATQIVEVIQPIKKRQFVPPLPVLGGVRS